ncbi:phosphatase PAP2 family protein [Pseudobutyrivibrio xylanivorans]|uniref:Phosphatase PAP2 family protein n=1 Tax=Pseudobutyrivibrio xylanivorans TaxID=185007 RepID=A0A5P6VLI9_PSEXY|nr:phosphatase PAP2 family protein [Pseudobutyrivibrio xylanivorans]QFJ53506.1 phosphatase PAP2 family protein [Pseudobutyrivibrio xylanivorans]
MISYSNLSARIKDNNGLVTALNVLDKAITYITVLFYVGLLAYCLYIIPVSGGTLLYRCLLVPGVSFALVSFFRKVISSPRPYEAYNFVPALKKDTKGKSFPSRHVFSIFMVAFTYFQVSTVIGIVLLVLGVALAVIRVVGGVHFIKDVVAGAAMAFLVATICYWIFCGVFGLIMLPF